MKLQTRSKHSPYEPQKPRSAPDLIAESRGVFESPVLVLLVESGLCPTTLDHYTTKILGWPNHIGRKVRAAAKLRDQYPADWDEHKKVSLDGKYGVSLETIDHRLADSLFIFEKDERLPQTMATETVGGSTNIKVATKIKMGGSNALLNHPVLLRPVKITVAKSIFTNFDGDGSKDLWYGPLDVNGGYLRHFSSYSDGDSDLGSLSYHQFGLEKKWHWHKGYFSQEKLRNYDSGIRVTFSNFVQDADVDYGMAGYSDRDDHIAPRFIRRVNITQKVAATETTPPITNSVQYKGYFDNHPDHCSDGMVIYRRIIPLDKEKTLVIRAVYELCGCENKQWHPVPLYTVPGCECFIHMIHGTNPNADIRPEQVATIQQSAWQIYEQLYHRQPEGGLGPSAWKRFRDYLAFDAEQVFGYGLLENPERDLIEVFTAPQ